MSADCDACGVRAIGRCLNCGKAFCMSHQGRTPAPSVPYVDQCSACTAKQNLVESQQRAKRAAPKEWVQRHGATVLREADVPMTPLWGPVRLRKRWWHSHPHEVMSESEYGWFLGDILWHYSWETARSGGSKQLLRPTMLMLEAKPSVSLEGPLRLVVLEHGLLRADQVGTGNVLDWADVESKVRRLSGK